MTDKTLDPRKLFMQARELCNAVLRMRGLTAAPHRNRTRHSIFLPMTTFDVGNSVEGDRALASYENLAVSLGRWNRITFSLDAEGRDRFVQTTFVNPFGLFSGAGWPDEWQLALILIGEQEGGRATGNYAPSDLYSSDRLPELRTGGTIPPEVPLLDSDISGWLSWTLDKGVRVTLGPGRYGHISERLQAFSSSAELIAAADAASLERDALDEYVSDGD